MDVGGGSQRTMKGVTNWTHPYKESAQVISNPDGAQSKHVGCASFSSFRKFTQDNTAKLPILYKCQEINSILPYISFTLLSNFQPHVRTEALDRVTAVPDLVIISLFKHTAFRRPHATHSASQNVEMRAGIPHRPSVRKKKMSHLSS